MTANRLFIITGDHSGDMHAAHVVKALRQRQPDIQIEAVGGTHLQALGVPLLSDQSRMGRIGFGSVLGAPYHYLLGQKILRHLDTFKPEAVLLIDYGVFNLWMAKQLKQRGFKVFYFIPPQVWASRGGRIRKIKAHVDHVFCIFPFEEPLYQRHGIPVTYVGHPLVKQLPDPVSKADFCQAYGLDPEKPLLGIFPGSRKLEIDYLLKPVVGSFPRLLKEYPAAQLVIGKAASLNPAHFNRRLQEALAAVPPETASAVCVVENQNHALLSASNLALTKSGTVTLEAALYDTPMVLIYKLHPIVYQVAVRIAYLPCIGLPNILTDMDNPIVPELWQGHANPAEISQALLPLFSSESPQYQRQMAGFQAIRQALNKGGAPENVADGILKLLGSSS